MSSTDHRARVTEKTHGRDRLDPFSYWSAAFSQRLETQSRERSSLEAPSTNDLLDWEGEINALTFLLTAAKERRNACSVTGAMPVEILSRVFEHLLDVAPLLDTDEHDFCRGWLVVTQVCRRWRAVATANASLWQNIYIVSVPLWDLFIRNSTNLPLFVYGCIGEQRDLSRKMLFVREQLPRIKELKLHTHRGDGAQSLGRSRWKSLVETLNTFRDTLPCLETLELDSDGFETTRLVAEFFTRVAIELREVNLRQIPYPAGAVPPKLRSLTLDKTDLSDPRGLFDALRLLPTLASLSLISSLDVPLDPVVGEHIEVPGLRHLFIKNDIQPCMSLWKSLHTHPLSYVEIDSSPSVTGIGTHLVDIAEATASHIHYPRRPKLTQLDLFANDIICDFTMGLHTESAGLYGETSSTPTLSHPHPSPGLKVVLPLLYRSSPYHVAEVLLCVLSVVMEDEWIVIRQAGDIRWNEQLLFSFFSSVYLVRFIAVYNVPSETVLAICSALSRLSANSTPRLLPGLTMLHFEGVDFGCPECDNERSAIPFLSDALASRAAEVPDDSHWHDVRYLNIKSCSVAEENIARWKESVPSLLWDGDEGEGHWPHTGGEAFGDDDFGRGGV